MSILIIWLSLLSSVISGLFGRKIGVTGSKIISISLLIFSLFFLILIVWDYLSGNGNTIIVLLNNLNSGILYNNWVLSIDSLVLSILIPVLLISFIVHIYSASYMSADPHIQRFFSYLGLFTGSIVLLVTSNSLVQLFVGWEAIGISSYLLISFWYSRLAASQAALSAFIINRLGDVALSIASYLIFVSLNTLNFNSILAITIESNIYTLITITLLIAAIAKSAQIGFNTWLPAAIEGPTPVSALIHAATLVTAGAFLLLRLSPILEESSTSLLIVGFVGSITAVFAGTVGIVQSDLKRVIAFSTCSQIGYLFLSIGLGQYNAALFHLMTHAIFKALLFLSAGIIIHSIGDNQDLRRIGGLLYYLPIAYITIMTGSLSLIALPFLTGFYSKELILELAFVQFTLQGNFIYFIGTFAAGLTGFYSFRLIYLTFYSHPNSRINTYLNIHHSDWILIFPLIILFFFSVIFGYFFKDAYTGLGSSLLSDNLALSNSIVEAELYISPLFKFVPLLVTLLGSILGISYSTTILEKNVTIYNYLSMKWALDNLINYLGFKALEIGFNASKLLDRGIFEFVGPFGASSLLSNISTSLTLSNTVSRYALVIIIGLIFFILNILNFSPILLLLILIP